MSLLLLVMEISMKSIMGSWDRGSIGRQSNTDEAFCSIWQEEWDRRAIKVGEKTIPNGAWYYRNPSPAYEKMANYIAFYPGKMDACYVNDEKVQAQESDFYGGWITSKIVGPFKGGAGTSGW